MKAYHWSDGSDGRLYLFISSKLVFQALWVYGSARKSIIELQLFMTFERHLLKRAFFVAYNYFICHNLEYEDNKDRHIFSNTRKDCQFSWNLVKFFEMHFACTSLVPVSRTNINYSFLSKVKTWNSFFHSIHTFQNILKVPVVQYHFIACLLIIKMQRQSIVSIEQGRELLEPLRILRLTLAHAKLVKHTMTVTVWTPWIGVQASDRF